MLTRYMTVGYLKKFGTNSQSALRLITETFFVTGQPKKFVDLYF